jgi:fluoroacetyl-CoA thioesterase
MKIEPGISFSKKFIVKDEWSAQKCGSGNLDVLGTPFLILSCENSCFEFVEKQMDPGFTTVGTRVDLSHLAPSKPGASFQVDSTINSVENNKIDFIFSVYEGETKIAHGKHTRFIVNIDKFLKKLK